LLLVLQLSLRIPIVLNKVNHLVNLLFFDAVEHDDVKFDFTHDLQNLLPPQLAHPILVVMVGNHELLQLFV